MSYTEPEKCVVAEDHRTNSFCEHPEVSWSQAVVRKVIMLRENTETQRRTCRGKYNDPEVIDKEKWEISQNCITIQNKSYLPCFPESLG